VTVLDYPGGARDFAREFLNQQVAAEPADDEPVREFLKRSHACTASVSWTHSPRRSSVGRRRIPLLRLSPAIMATLWNGLYSEGPMNAAATFEGFLDLVFPQT